MKKRVRLNLRSYYLLAYLVVSCSLAAQYPYRFQQFRNIPDRDALWNQSLTHYQEGRSDSAFSVACQISDDYYAQGQWDNYLFASNYCAVILGESKQAERSFQLLSNAQKTFKAESDTFNYEYFESYRILSANCRLLGKKDLSFFYLLQGLDILEKMNCPSVYAYYCYSIALQYRKVHDSFNHRKYLSLAINLISNEDDPFAKAIYYTILSEGVSSLQLEVKIDLLLASIQLMEEVGTTCDYQYVSNLRLAASSYSLGYRDFTQAFLLLERSIESMRQCAYPLTSTYNLYNRLGDVYRKTAQYDKAEENLNVALKIAIEAYGSTSLQALLSHLYLARLFRYSKAYEKAESHILFCFSIGESMAKENFPKQAECLGEMGLLYSAWGKNDLAMIAFQRRLFLLSQAEFSSLDDLPPLPQERYYFEFYSSLFGKIETYTQYSISTSDEDLFDVGIAHCLLADSLLSLMNYDTFCEISGINNTDRMSDVAKQASLLCKQAYQHTHDEKYIKVALGFRESAAANYLRFILYEKDTVNSTAYSEFRSAIQYLEGELSKADSDSVRVLLSAEILDLKSKGVEQLIKEVPIVEERDQITDKVDLSFIQKEMPDSVLLLSFQQTNDSTLLRYTMDNTTYTYKEFPFDKLLLLTKQFRRALKSGSSMSSLPQSQLLSDVFIPDNYKDYKHLVFLGAELIGQLPISCLMKDSIPLVATHSVSYNSSIYLWNKSLMADKTRDAMNVLAMCPSFVSETHLESELRDADRQSHVAALPHALDEVNAIKHICNTNNVNCQLLVGDQACKDSLLLYAQDCALLHISSHAFVDAVDYNKSGMLLGTGKQVLDLNAIYQLRISAELVVLSACKTGVGESFEGEGVMALPRGFIYAGVANVMASLWQIHDERTKELMTSFYEAYLGQGLSSSEALRRAQCQSMDRGIIPLDWAGFFIIGE